MVDFVVLYNLYAFIACTSLWNYIVKGTVHLSPHDHVFAAVSLSIAVTLDASHD